MLDRGRIDCVFRKGTDRKIDSYSAFFDNGHRRATGLSDYLQKRRAEQVFVMGLATDYCVRYTALDSRKLGFRTALIQEGCRGVELQAGDVGRALDEMRRTGVRIVGSEALVKPGGPDGV